MVHNRFMENKNVKQQTLIQKKTDVESRKFEPQILIEKNVRGLTSVVTSSIIEIKKKFS